LNQRRDAGLRFTVRASLEEVSWQSYTRSAKFSQPEVSNARMTRGAWCRRLDYGHAVEGGSADVVRGVDHDERGRLVALVDVDDRRVEATATSLYSCAASIRASRSAAFSCASRIRWDVFMASIPASRSW
jgi:hypothetical protein